MPQVPRINPGTSVPNLGSVGRLRVNAPVEAFGGGAAARGIAEVGKGLQSIGQGVQDIQARANKADISSAQTEAQNIYNRASIEAKRANSKEEVNKLFEDARKQVNEMQKSRIRSSEAQREFATWHQGEAGRRSNQALSISYNVEDRVTQAKNENTRRELTTSAVDENSLANNKQRLLDMWSTSTLSEAEIEKGLSEDLRSADIDFASKLYNRIDVNEDTSKEMKIKLDQYNKFVETANSLTETDRAKLRKENEKANRAIELKSEDEDVDVLVTSVISSESQEDIQSEMGQADALTAVSVMVDKGGYKTLEKRDRIKSKAMASLSRRFEIINKQRRADIDEYLSNPESDIQDFLRNPNLSSRERNAGLKVLADRQKPVIVDVVRSTINGDIENFDYESYTTDDYIAIVTKMEMLPTAERKIYKEILDGKIEATKNKYEDEYKQAERILNQRFKLTGKDVDKDLKVYLHGKKVKLTPEERSLEKLKMMRRLRDMGSKKLDNPQMFELEFKKMLDTERELTADELAADKAIEFAK